MPENCCFRTLNLPSLNLPNIRAKFLTALHCVKSDIYIKNRKARFEYELLEELVAGIVLRGTEIKSIRDGQASIDEAFCQFVHGELYVVNMNIAEYKFGTYANHEPKRQRKLLVQANEIKKWNKKVNEKGLTIVPTALFINESDTKVGHQEVKIQTNAKDQNLQIICSRNTS